PAQSPPDDPPRAEEVRAVLDRALVRLREVVDGRLPIALIERALGEALQQVYVAMASSADWGAFRAATSEATEHVRAALAHLMSAPSDDAVAGELMELVA